MLEGSVTHKCLENPAPVSDLSVLAIRTYHHAVHHFVITQLFI